MKEESLLLLSDLQKLINQVVLIDYTIIILEGDKMIIKQYDRVLMKDGSNASIVEIFEDKKSFIADIERNDDIDTEEIGIDDIKKVL